METFIINSRLAFIKVKDVMPTKSNLYDIACKLGLDVDRYTIYTDNSENITIRFDKTAASSIVYRPEKFRDIEELKKRREREKGSPASSIITPSPLMLLDKIKRLKSWITDSLKYDETFKERYQGEISDEDLNQIENSLKEIENKYNKILEESIILDMQQELEPYTNKIMEWEELLSNYFVKEEIIPSSVEKQIDLY